MRALPLLVLLACSAAPPAASVMKLSSPDFPADGPIPIVHTCEGTDLSPALAWSGAPEGTRSFALIVDDPDAPDPAKPRLTWVHWVVYAIPADATGLPRGGLPAGARQGRNDWQRQSYGGPCPPVGRHRYFHKLYALDIAPGDLGQPTKADLLGVMEGHVLAEAQVVGTYEKVGR